MDYTSRNIFHDDGNYRYVGRTYTTGEDGVASVDEEGTKIDTTYTGDVWLEVAAESFDADMSDEMIAIIEEYYPSLAPVTTLRDVFPDSSIVHDTDDVVCFKTGIYDKYVIGDAIGYSRKKKTSDFEFEMFMSLADEDYSNLSATNPYVTDEV